MRDAQTQAKIKAFANKYFKANEKKMLVKILGGVPKFTDEEAKHIKRVVPAAFAVGQGNAGFPILQFYDYAFTVDEAENKLKGLETLALNLNDLESKANRGLVDAQLIIHGGIRDADYKKLQAGTAQFDKKMLLGGDPAKRNDDEKELLGKPILNMLTALGQGNYKIKYSGNNKGAWVVAGVLSQIGGANKGGFSNPSIAGQRLMKVNKTAAYQNFLKRYYNLAKKYSLIRKKSTIGLDAGNVLHMRKGLNKGENWGEITRCGPGTIPVYRNRQGAIIPYRHAIIMVGGKKVLAPDVDPNQTTCQASVSAGEFRALSGGARSAFTQLGQSKAFQGQTPVAFNAMGVPAGILGISKAFGAKKRRRRKKAVKKRRKYRAVSLADADRQFSALALGLRGDAFKAKKIKAATNKKKPVKKRKAATKKKKPVKKRVVKRKKKVVRRKKK